MKVKGLEEKFGSFIKDYAKVGDFPEQYHQKVLIEAQTSKAIDLLVSDFDIVAPWGRVNQADLSTT